MKAMLWVHLGIIYKGENYELQQSKSPGCGAIRCHHF
jgi:hypothetical protein